MNNHARVCERDLIFLGGLMLEYGAKAEDPVVSFDGRHSEVAAELQRGVCRALRALGHCVVTELPLATGRRADVVAMSGSGDFLIVEIKSCLLDYRTDAKWQDYFEYCDRLYCEVPSDLHSEISPEVAGLIFDDRYGGVLVREGVE